MTINRLSQDYVGLFGQVENGSLSNIGVIGGSFVGARYVGALAGSLLNSSVHNAHATGSASGNEGGSDFVGGLVGVNYHGSSITKSFATGMVSGINNVGGLVGWNYGKIDQAYASGNVNGRYGVGGLVGLNDGGQIRNAYATGAVNGDTGVGGLIGNIQDGGQIRNTYASGAVTGSGSNIGGLVGSNEILTPGASLATIDASYWNTQTSGRSSSAGGEGRTTQEMQGGGSRPIFAGWDFASIWKQEAAAPVFVWNFIPRTVASVTQNSALTENVNAVQAAMASDLKANIKPMDIDDFMKSVDPKLIEAIYKSREEIFAETMEFIAEQLEKYRNAIEGSDAQALAGVNGMINGLIGDYMKTALANSGLNPAQVADIIADVNKKISGAASPDLSKVQPLDKTLTDPAMDIAKALKQAEIDARRNALNERKEARDKAQAELKGQAAAMATSADQMKSDVVDKLLMDIADARSKILNAQAATQKPEVDKGATNGSTNGAAPSSQLDFAKLDGLNQKMGDSFSQMMDFMAQMNEATAKIIAGMREGAPAGTTAGATAATPAPAPDNATNHASNVTAMLTDLIAKTQAIREAEAAKKVGEATATLDAQKAAADQARAAGQQKLQNAIAAAEANIAKGAVSAPGTATGAALAGASAAATQGSRTNAVRPNLRDVMTAQATAPLAGRPATDAGSAANPGASPATAALLQKGAEIAAEAAQRQNRVTDLLGK
jgi:hypothetical protein